MKKETSVSAQDTQSDENESALAAMFWGTIFWTLFIGSFAWLLIGDEYKIHVIRIGGAVLTLTLVMGALTLWPQRKYYVLEMSVVALIASAVLWQDGNRVWAVAIGLLVFCTDVFVVLKKVCETWLNSYDDENHSQH